MHKDIPIPFMQADRVGTSIEGIWQGLKVFEKDGVNVDYIVTTSTTKINSWRKFTKQTGSFMGWQKGT